MPKNPYATDLMNTAWEIIAPVLPAALPGGRTRTTDIRAVLNSIFYLLRMTGCHGIAWSDLSTSSPTLTRPSCSRSLIPYPLKILPYRCIARGSAYQAALPLLSLTFTTAISGLPYLANRSLRASAQRFSMVLPVSTFNCIN